MRAPGPGPGGETTADRLYRFLMEEEDARVCKDIPEEACIEVPGNFFKLGASQTLTKLADELSSAKTVLPWVLTSVGAPASLIGLLVPIRESGSLLPQMVIAGVVRNRPRRKYIWVLGGILQALALMGMGAAALVLRGPVAGATLLAFLILFSLARGLVSVASKDVIGKTVPKTRRGRLTGFTSALSGVLVLLLGGLLAALVTGSEVALTVAVAHLLFNVIGILIIWPVRWIPLSLARWLGAQSAKSRLSAAVYVLVVFFGLPLALIALFR